ncbi:outer membrane beta-barrel protein [Halobacteriovorax sp. HLS]|uniref:outer membrane beta-barrel protein n=1 Tax=Halobacteriovorax sp. HLS TaxID=2234000 RepID=UPI000FD8F7D2|nr:outer membrane beta-barrel protein [Halobacteriovorax sp. HLS]
MKSIICIAFILFSLPSFAQVNSLFGPSVREGRSEIYFGFLSSSSFKLKGASGGELNAQNGFGGIIEGGYNLTKRLYFGMLFSMHNVNYRSNVTLDNSNEDSFISDLLFSSVEFTSRFNLLPTTFTPYVEGSMGITHINSGVPSGQEVNRCWWDPYYDKQVCETQYPNETKVAFSYSVGAGIHYEITSRANIQLAARYRFIQSAFNDNFPELFSFGLSLGYIIP